MAAVREAEGDDFASLLLAAFWEARTGTAADRPLPQSEVRLRLDAMGLGDRFLELWPLLRGCDRAFSEHVQQRIAERAERARSDRNGPVKPGG